MCVEHTDYRPVPLEGVVTLAKRLLGGDIPEGATTVGGIRNAKRATVERSEADANG